MANAKTYNELNQASAVNASDLVAVAQSDKTELQKTTVSDLANAVGELNQAGALAELSLATSIGKNLLAQRLNEKGVQNITPNNTLIEMADAVDKLQTGTGSTMLKDRLVTNIINNDYASNIGYNPYAVCRLPNGYSAIQKAGKIFVCKIYGDYNTIDDVINNADMSIDMHTPSASTDFAYITASKDGKTLITHAFDSAGTVDIYDVNYEESQLTYVKSITGITLYNNICHMAIKNDRSLLAWYKEWDRGTYIVKVDDTSVISNSLGIGAYGTGSTFAFDEEKDTLYVYAFASTTDIKLYTVNYTYNGSEITFTSTYSALPIGSYELDKYSLLLIQYPQVERTDAVDIMTDNDYGVYKVPVRIADISKNAISFVATFFNIYSQYYSSYTYHKANRHRPIIASITSDNNDMYVIKYAYPWCTLTYTKSNNKLANTQIYSRELEGMSVWGNNDAPVPFICFGINSNSSFWVSSVSADGINYNYSSYRYISQITQTSEEKRVGYRSDVNGKSAYYLRNQFTQADIESGKFDLTTKQVEIPADN